MDQDNKELKENNIEDIEEFEATEVVENVIEETDVEDSNDTIEEADETTAEITREEFNALLKKAEKKGKRKAWFTIAILFLIFSLLAGGVSVIKQYLKKSSGIDYEGFQTKSAALWKIVKTYYLWQDDVNTNSAVEEMYKGLIDSLGDPYSVYYTKEEFAEVTESYEGEYSGIGAYISQNMDTMEAFISRPMPGSPAEEAGIKANDYIYEVDHEDVLGQDLNVIVSKIKGPEGTTVDIGVKHDNKGEIETITVERRTIEVTMVESEMLEDNIGRIWILEFEGKTLSQFDKAYDDLLSQGMEGLIIDLRDNPGGDVAIVTKLADEFLDEGMIVYTKDNKGNRSEIKSDAECKKIPMVIITNENSASASEILTGSLKDRGVATVVGNTTYGKGIMQSVLSLPDGSGLKITDAEYYLPNDECIHGVGIEPDYEVDLDVEAYRKNGDDAQKDKAVEVMKELLKK